MSLHEFTDEKLARKQLWASLSYKYMWLVTLISDAGLLWTFATYYELETEIENEDGQAGVVVLIVIFVLSLLASFRIQWNDRRKAREILDTDDVSDCFLHPVSFAKKGAYDMDAYCFLAYVYNNLKFWDRRLLDMVHALSSKWEMLLVIVPQAVVSLTQLGVQLELDLIDEEIASYRVVSLGIASEIHIPTGK